MNHKYWLYLLMDEPNWAILPYWIQLLLFLYYYYYYYYYFALKRKILAGYTSSQATSRSLSSVFRRILAP